MNVLNDMEKEVLNDRADGAKMIEFECAAMNFNNHFFRNAFDTITSKKHVKTFFVSNADYPHGTLRHLMFLCNL